MNAKVVEWVLWFEVVVFAGVILWSCVSDQRERRRDRRRPEPEVVSSPPPYADFTAVVLAMIEKNAETQAQMLERGLEAITTTVQRAAFGGPEPPEDLRSPAGALAKSPPDPDAPPWEDWPEELTENTDESIPELDDVTRPRAVGVSQLPDFSGERLDLGG